MNDFSRQKTWHRQLLEHLLQKNSHLIHGRILDVGSKNRRYDHLFKGEVTAVDIVENKESQVAYGDIEKGLDFPNEMFDSLICLEVFEYLENYKKALAEIYRLLRPGGQAIISMPFLYHEHEDKIRLTSNYLASQLTPFSSVEIKTIGNAYTVIWDILRKKWFSGQSDWQAKMIWWLVLWPFLILIRPWKNSKDNYYSGLFIILRK